MNGLKVIIPNSGWPDSPSELPEMLRDFYNFRDELLIEDGILFKGVRIDVPVESRGEVLQRIHSSHIGLHGCLRLAREAVFYPGMVKEIPN